MTVYELSEEQFNELKNTFYFSMDNTSNFEYESEEFDNYCKTYWEDVDFVNDDFFCSCGDNLENIHAF